MKIIIAGIGKVGITLAQQLSAEGHDITLIDQDNLLLENTNAYLAAYVVILAISFLLLCLDRFSVTTNITAVLACFNNIGPGLEAVGPTCNFGGFSVFSKIVLILDMLAGRLEIFPILVLFSRSTWTGK